MASALSGFIGERTEAILGRARGIVERHHAEAAHADLVPAMERFLGDLRTALDDDHVEEDDSLQHRHSAAAVAEGEATAHAGLACDVVVRSFGALCDSITSIAETEGVSFPARDFRILNQSLDGGIAQAIEAYADVRARADHRTSASQLGALAHELRNALGSLAIGFDTLREGRVGMRSRTAHTIERGLARMQLLVDGALAAATLQAGVPLQPSPERLADVVRDLTESYVGTATFDLQLDDDVVVAADRRLLVSAIGNLVQNAVKYTRRGTTVTIRVRAEGEVAVVEVEDECGGLRVPDPELLFREFEQGNGGRGGVGLGLAIVRDAVLAHGGAVAVRDLAPVGCVFTLRWPMRPPAA